MRSFCCVPAGVFITTLVLLFMLVVVDARSLMGVVFLSVAVTVQLGELPAGRSAMMCATPAPCSPDEDAVAVFWPLAPAVACIASALSCS